MFNFKEYIINQLPDYFIEQDSYKDVNQKGFVQRYLELMGDELDEYYYSQIAGIVDQVNPLTVSRWEYLDYIAFMLGDIPGNITDNTYVYQRMLTFIISVYKIKGTIPSFAAILYPLGVQMIGFEELPELNVVYDEDYTYDQDDVAYDQSCPTCSDYNIFLEFPNDFTAELYQKILAAIGLVEPIIAVRARFSMNGVYYTEYIVDVMYDVITGEPIFDNPYDPTLTLEVSPNGTLIVGGDLDQLYFTDEQDNLIFLKAEDGEIVMLAPPIIKRTPGQRPDDPNPEDPTLKVGWYMYVDLGSYVGDTGIVITHQWLRDEVVIPGATGITYLTVEADANKTISVIETATGDNSIHTQEVYAGQIENHLPLTITGLPSNENLAPFNIGYHFITITDPDGTPLTDPPDWSDWQGGQGWGPPWYWYPGQGTNPEGLPGWWNEELGIYGDYSDATHSNVAIVLNDGTAHVGESILLKLWTEHPTHHARKLYTVNLTVI